MTAAPAPRNSDSFSSVLAYPAQAASITTLLALSLGMLLTIVPLVGFLIQLGIWAAAFRYAVEVFERSANGAALAPEFALESDGMGLTLLILQGLLFVCVWWLDARVDTVWLRWLGIGLIAFIQPVMTMTTAMNRNLGSAWNPGRLSRAIAAIGAPYALLMIAGVALGALHEAVESVIAGGRAFVLLLVSGIGIGDAQQVRGTLAGNWLVVIVGQMLAGFVWFYALVAYFHLLGDSVHTRQHALGFTPVSQQPLRPEDRHVPLLRQVDRMLAKGDVAGAARTLGACVASEPHTSPAMHARYRELLARIGDHAGLLDHARARIDALLVADAPREAIGLLRDALDRDSQFRPSSAERTSLLAQAAEQHGQPELTLALLRDFPMRYPRDPAIPANATLAARLLLERHSDIAGARAVLQSAIDRMLPAHPMYADLLQKRNHLDQLATRVANPAAP